jgi:hypothetical protein
MMKNIISFTLSLSLLLLTGCGGNIQLKGKVVFSDDGSPVPIGTVCFEMDSYLARGNLQSDGTFAVSSIKENDGLPKGTYRVYITGSQKLIGTSIMGLPLYESLIDEKYAATNTSGITIDVSPSTKYFEITVDRYQPQNY